MENISGPIAILDNEYVSTALKVLLAVYGALAAPKLPESIKNLFGNVVFRLLLLFLIAYLGNRRPDISLMVVIVFVITMNVLSEQELKENFEQI